MPSLADPEAPPGPPGQDRVPSRRCSRLLPLLVAIGAAAIGAAAIGAAAAAAACLGLLRAGERPGQAATAAHLLLSGGSLQVPSGPSWRYEEGISGVFLSADVRLVAKDLQVAVGGLYLLYGQFAVTCTTPSCPPGTVTLRLLRNGSRRHPVLVVPLVLPGGGGGSHPTRSGLAQAVGQLDAGDVLRLEVTGDVAGDGWQLAQDEREGNFVGLLRIASG